MSQSQWQVSRQYVADQGLRRPVRNGALEQSTIGADKVTHRNLGYESFNDKNYLHAQYIEPDLLHLKEAKERVFSRLRPSPLFVFYTSQWETRMLGEELETEIVHLSELALAWM